MSVVSGFKYDLFISYAHQNDRPWHWVTEFIETLKEELASKSRDFTIWWDPALRTGENFDVAIADAISQSAVFLSILSPAYGDSTYCKQEVEEFRQQRHPAFGLLVGSMSRMQAIVIDKEFTRDEWAPEFRSTSPQPFFDEKSLLFSKPAALATSDPWIQALWKVRDSVWAVLHDMRHQKERGANIPRTYGVSGSGMTSTPTLHIAEVTDDQYRLRENLRSALRDSKDFEVNAWSDPVAPPTSGPNTLSVHLFGKYPGHNLGNSNLSLSRTQLEQILQSKPARRPLVWLARDLNLDDAETPEHKNFLQSLINSNDVEVLRSDFEDLKDEVAKRMRVSETPGSTRIHSHREAPIIHIWHSMDNPVCLQPLKDYLTERDCAIQIFNYTSTPTEKMQSRLAVCDGLIVPYTMDSRTWAEDVMTEAFRVRRREERPTAFAPVELPPPGESEFNFEHPRVIPVHLREARHFEEMEQFLAKLEESDA
jgi:TIR domain